MRKKPNPHSAAANRQSRSTISPRPARLKTCHAAHGRADWKTTTAPPFKTHHGSHGRADWTGRAAVAEKPRSHQQQRGRWNGRPPTAPRPIRWTPPIREEHHQRPDNIRLAEQARAALKFINRMEFSIFKRRFFVKPAPPIKIEEAGAEIVKKINRQAKKAQRMNRKFTAAQKELERAAHWMQQADIREAKRQAYHEHAEAERHELAAWIPKPPKTKL